MKSLFFISVLLLAFSKPIFAIEFQYDDLTEDDQERVFGGNIDSSAQKLKSNLLPQGFDILSPSSAPSYSSVRARMSPVKDQMGRGTCSVFAAVALIEFTTDHILSEQCLAKLSSNSDPGTIDQRLQWATKNGIYLQEDCNYLGQKNGRDVLPPDLGTKRRIGINGRLEVQSNFLSFIDLAYIKDRVSKNIPVGVSTYVPGGWWHNYGNKSILTIPSQSELDHWKKNDCTGSGKSCPSHAFVITGYDDNTQTLEFKNSWGPFWKDSGYGKMSYSYYQRFRTSNPMVSLFPKGWKRWENLGGSLKTNPVALSLDSGQTHIFGFGPGNNLIHKWFVHNSWSHWEDLGGSGKSIPAVTWLGSGGLHIFARGIDDALYHKGFVNSSWSEWEDLRGQLSSEPVVLGFGTAEMHIFAVGSQNSLVHRFYKDGNWSGWEDLGGHLTSTPSVVSSRPGRIDIFARGVDRGLYYKYFENGWSNWQGLGGHVHSNPVAVSWGSGRLDVFVRGDYDALFHRSFDRNWSEWSALGGRFDSDPIAIAPFKGGLDVFVRGDYSALYRRSFRQNSWISWEPLSGSFDENPSLVSDGSDRLQVFVKGKDTSLKHKWTRLH